MSSTRLKGSSLRFTLGGVDYYADISALTFENEEADGGVVTFADAENGGARQHFMTGSAIQSTQSGSFWRMVWASTGATVSYDYAPHGNDDATADEPHFIGTAKIGPKPSIGGEAGANVEQTFEFRFDIDGEPTLDLGTGADPVITAISPAGQSVGETVLIAGTRFTGATDVKFAAVSATSFIVVSDGTIVAVIPAGTGAKAVTVITPEGTSASVSYTVAA